MCSASSRITRSRISRPTSISMRSAPLPPRSTAIACSLPAAWVTEAPLSMAILVAVMSWPFNVPTMRSRMDLLLLCIQRSQRWRSGFLGLDDFGHGHAELVLHENHLAPRHEPVIDVDIDGLTDTTIEFQNAARPELEQRADVHLGAAEHGGHLHRNVEHGLEVGSDSRDLLVLAVSNVVDCRRIGGVEV